jgi:hypothetical protein
MHGSAVCPAFDQTVGIYFLGADGKPMKRMAQKLCLHTAKIFHYGLRISGRKKMLSPQSAELDFFYGHSCFPLFIG